MLFKGKISVTVESGWIRLGKNWKSEESFDSRQEQASFLFSNALTGSGTHTGSDSIDCHIFSTNLQRYGVKMSGPLHPVPHLPSWRKWGNFNFRSCWMWRTWIHCVGRMQSVRMLRDGVNVVAPVCKRIKIPVPSCAWEDPAAIVSFHRWLRSWTRVV
jgi:hypothetical protein